MRTSTGAPSAWKISDLTIWLSSQPIASAACAAVRVASGKERTGTWSPSPARASANRGWAAAGVGMRGTPARGGGRTSNHHEEALSTAATIGPAESPPWPPSSTMPAAAMSLR